MKHFENIFLVWQFDVFFIFFLHLIKGSSGITCLGSLSGRAKRKPMRPGLSRNHGVRWVKIAQLHQKTSEISTFPAVRDQAVDLLLQLPSLPLFPLLRDKDDRSELGADSGEFGRWMQGESCYFGYETNSITLTYYLSPLYMCLYVYIWVYCPHIKSAFIMH